ncbi:unnamed protein product [Effrenium voratum]|nr:unnamed protein product [Effrenium voratum]
MARKNELSLGACVKYNIGSFFAVFCLGWIVISNPTVLGPCPVHDEPVKLAQGVSEALKSWKAQRKGPSEDEDEDDEEAEEAEEVAQGAPGALDALHSAKEAGTPQWVFCAAQWQDCTCGGAVRWGNKETWAVMEPKKKGELLTVRCSVQVLEDLLPGDDGKHCECQVLPGSAFYRGLNPMWLPDAEAERLGAPLASSCELWAKAKGQGAWGAQQWRATEFFCGPWDQEPSGDREIDLDTMRKLMRARVDARFTEVYHKYFGRPGEKQGWADRAYVNYFAGPPDGKHAKMTEELIRSVHTFSSELIVVVNFGMTCSSQLTAKRFPRLVLLHAEPMDVELHRGFNFNKLRAFLFARVLTGVGLDSDQFVAPYVDRLFEMTEREITKSYPFPIMPVHFLDRGPKDLGVWWGRYCPDTACSLQTMRWGHAHPTWTFWALPFIGRWLRRNFRDETLPEIVGKVSAPALRVVEIPEDEDLLNVALWEEKATKQWCKFDITDPMEFQFLFEWRARSGNKCGGPGCANIYADRRFYKHGAAKLFYTAHHAVNPAETHKQVDRIEKKFKEKNWPASTVARSCGRRRSCARLTRKRFVLCDCPVP